MSEISYNSYPVVFVDDEPDQIQVFRLNFRKDFDLHLASSGAEALDLLKELGGRAAVLLTDQRMPAMSGVELLERAKEISPETVRMVVTAYKDAEPDPRRGQQGRCLPLRGQALGRRTSCGSRSVARSSSYLLVQENKRLIERLQGRSTPTCSEEIRAHEYPTYDGDRRSPTCGLRQATIEDVKPRSLPTRSTVLDPRRDRDRQGADRARDPLRQSREIDKPLVKLNCAALPETLLETRAVRTREGRVHRR